MIYEVFSRDIVVQVLHYLKEKYLAFSHQLSFKHSVRFCKNLGGELAIAENDLIIEEARKAIKLINVTNNCHEHFYSGYWFKDGAWRNVNTNEKLITDRSILINDNLLLILI